METKFAQKLDMFRHLSGCVSERRSQGLSEYKLKKIVF